MNHSIDFFHDEIRYGFYVPSAIKQSWASALDVLAEIDRICKKYDIRYFADWGTFLGAVRHGGFVPWDDDLDICMLRPDYEKFRKVADAELPQQYVIHDYERHENHWLFLSRVVNNEHICFEEEHLNDNYNFPWLSGVDIFIKDYLYKDPEKEKGRCDEILRILAVADGVRDGSISSTALKERLAEFALKYNCGFPDANYIQKSKNNCDGIVAYSGEDGTGIRALAVSLYKLAEAQMARVPESEADKIGQIFPWVLKGGPGEDKSHYENCEYLPFEDTLIPVPTSYNQSLALHYGDYNRIIKGVAAHDYPSFEAQKRVFENETGARLPEFSFDETMIKRAVPDKSGSLKELAKECLGEIKRKPPLDVFQQLCVDLGTMIEHVRGEADPHAVAIVKCLEEICEELYSISVSGSNEDETHTGHLGELVEQLERALDTHLFARSEVLFLPVGLREWECMKPYYEKEAANEAVDAYVVPLPLMLKNIYGQIQARDEEIVQLSHVEDYPESLRCKNFWDYDITLHCPDRIYIQNPYDAQNHILTVPLAYYAQNLINYTDELIYIPIGPVSEFSKESMPEQANLKYYVTAPGAVYADKVIAQSENIRQQYIDVLCSWAGENTRDFWEKKVQSADETCEDSEDEDRDYKCKDACSTNDDIGINIDEQRRKRLLYCVSSYEFDEHADDFEEKVRSRINTLKEAGDRIGFTLCAYPPCDDMQSDFNSIIERIADSAGVDILLYQGRDIANIPEGYDAYYGSSSPLVHEFVMHKKPVMIANYDI